MNHILKLCKCTLFFFLFFFLNGADIYAALLINGSDALCTLFQRAYMIKGGKFITSFRMGVKRNSIRTFFFKF